MTDALVVLLKFVGAAFLLSAAVGLIRFADPLQRMHASTKAGTVGAGFVLLGVMIQMGGSEVLFIGLATGVFLLLTIPIAGHLLGRATYISGACLDSLKGQDGLKGVLDRSPSALDERLASSPRER